MQPYIFGNTAVICVEIAVVPLKPLPSSPLTIGPVVVNTYGNNVFPTIVYVRCQIKTHSHNTVFMVAKVVPVQVKVSPHTQALELNKHLLPLCLARQAEMFAIPGNRVGKLLYGHFESLVLVKGVWQCHSLPSVVFKATTVGTLYVADL